MKKKLASLTLLAIAGTMGITFSSFLAPTEDYSDLQAYRGMCPSGATYTICSGAGSGCTPEHEGCH